MSMYACTRMSVSRAGGVGGEGWKKKERGSPADSLLNRELYVGLGPMTLRP